jgi:hypothetical protein
MSSLEKEYERFSEAIGGDYSINGFKYFLKMPLAQQLP